MLWNKFDPFQKDIDKNYISQKRTQMHGKQLWKGIPS